MRIRLIVGCCAALALAACSGGSASRSMGIGMQRDPSVALFPADSATAWSSFRLGGGLNVVVSAPSLPREFSWRVLTGAISSSPVVYHDLVLVDDNDHHLYAIDGASGALRWVYGAENELMSQPLYENGLIYVATGNSDCTVYFPPNYVVMGLGVNRIEAIDASTARETWVQGIAGTGMPTGLLRGGMILHADGAGTVLALDAKTGAFEWRHRLPSFFSMGAIVDGDDGAIYIGGGFPNAIYALDAKSGALRWTHPFPQNDGAIADDPMASTPKALVGMYLQPLRQGKYGWVVQVGSEAVQHVYALDKETGHMLWDRTLAGVRGIAPPYNESAIPLIYRNRVYIGSAVAPYVSAMDAQSGKALWQLRVRGPVKGGISAWNGILYFGDLSGYLWAVDARNGRVIGRLNESMEFNVGSPIIVNQTLVDGAKEGAVAIPLARIRAGS